MSAVLLVLGALLTIAGTALYAPEAAMIIAGVLLLAAGVDLERRP